MSLKDQLLFLRLAARSLSNVADPDACLDLIRKGSPYDQLFFGEVNDPMWLPILNAAGFYSKLPTASTADGKIIYPRHPPLFALKRLAKIDPAFTTRILESLKLPDNPAVLDQVIQTIVAVEEVGCSKRLLWTLERVLERQKHSDWLWLDDILAKWLSFDELDICLNGLKAVFKAAILSSEGGRSQDNWQISQIDSKVIGPLAAKRPDDVTRLLVEMLVLLAQRERTRIEGDEAYYVPGNHPDTGPDYDHPPTYWLRKFGSGSLGDHDLESTLADRLYAIGRHILESGDLDGFRGFDAVLRQDRWHLFRRLRWQLYADVPKLTLSFARLDTLERIPELCMENMIHGYEFALMLKSHSEQHGDAFLTRDEVAAFKRSVLSGPLVRQTNEVDIDYESRFHNLQLFPIRTLLRDIGREVPQSFLSEANGLSEDTYRRGFGDSVSGHVESVSPAQADEMKEMNDSDLWHFLNSWKPTQSVKWSEGAFEEESLGALGAKFSELLEASPSRFSHLTRWWTNLHRPMILQKCLERATALVGSSSWEEGLDGKPITDGDWRNWFGIASWIVEPAWDLRSEEDSVAPEQDINWNWSRMTVVRFLSTVVERKAPLPGDLPPIVARLLERLVGDFDPTLDKTDKPSMSDWLTTAINSVRGTAVEALLNFGLSQKSDTKLTGPESWIFDLISERLRRPDESIAVFAILGARLRLALHLFPERFAAEPNLLLPEKRFDHKVAFLRSHFLYDNPTSAIIEALPGILDAALECLKLTDQDEERRVGVHKFGSRLGTHLGFYYWNAAFRDQSTAEATLDRFFEIADPKTCAATIAEIGRIFADARPSEEASALYERVMQLWDRRALHIEECIETAKRPPAEFSGELSEFIDWIKCECFPFDWRFDRVMSAIRKIDKAPRAYSLMETLDRFTSDGGRIKEAMLILNALAMKISDEFRWSFNEEHLKPLLRRGLGSANSITRQNAENIQEALLRQGFFEYLDFGIE